MLLLIYLKLISMKLYPAFLSHSRIPVSYRKIGEKIETGINPVSYFSFCEPRRKGLCRLLTLRP